MFLVSLSSVLSLCLCLPLSMALTKTTKAAIGILPAMRRTLLQLQVGGARRAMGGGRGGGGDPSEDWPVKVRIGGRQVVGYGSNGEENYLDDVHYPFPAIRFKEDKGDVAGLREKEKGDWKQLTLADKKALYRASFAQTLAETEAATGEWKGILGTAMILVSCGILCHMFAHAVLPYDIPASLEDEEKMRAGVQFMIDARVQPIEGFTSSYDYEKEDWKWNL